MVLLPEEAEMTLAELRQMAARQQHQIEAQQQLLVAKEQRLKFLKQQEARHHNLAEQQLDTACLLNLRDKVEAQELKLRQLRALRGQVEQQKTNNVNLGAELDSIRALFSEKEKELNLAVSKVEELTRQLDEIRNNNNRKNYIMSSASSELENMKRELLYRTKLTEQQNNYICQQRENIALKQQDIATLDKKINELTQRLHRKRLLNDQLATQIHNASLSRNTANSVLNNGLYHAATIVTVEPLKREMLEPEHTQDDMAAKLHGSHKGDLGEFCLTKNDPKYQTLPYNTKFTLKGKHSEDSLSSSTEDESWSCQVDYSTNNKNNSPLSVVKPTNMCNFSPRPFNSPYISNNGVPKVDEESQNKNEENSQLLDNRIIRTEYNCAESEKDDKKDPNEFSDSANNNTNEPHPSNKTSSKSVHERIKDNPKGIPSKINKPVVPPKPALPVKPMLFNRHDQVTTTKEKNCDEKDLVNAALSVLQNKSSEVEKSTFRYPNSREPSHDTTISKSRIATYFPKTVLQTDSSISQDNRHSENIDPNDSPRRKPALGQLPIKPKPLTIRKTPGLEPPKLKVQPIISTNIRKSSESQLLSSHLKSTVNTHLADTVVTNTVESVIKSQDSKPSEEPVEESVVPKNDCDDSLQTEAEKIDLESPNLEQHSAEHDDIKTDESNQDDSTSKPDACPIDIELSIDEAATGSDEVDSEVQFHSAALRRMKKGNLKSEGSIRSSRRVSFDPLALLLDAALEGELELVKKTASEVPNPSAANDEGITALHNAICAGHFDVVTFLVEFGCDVNAQDSDGWTPLHCAASCNNLPMVKFLVERGACIFATTLSDHETAAEKCEEDEEGFDGCSEYLYSLQENLGVINNGTVYAVYDYEVQNPDELSFKDGDILTVLRKSDDDESEWWWSRLLDEEGYVPRNLLGLYPRVKYRQE